MSTRREVSLHNLPGWGAFKGWILEQMSVFKMSSLYRASLVCAVVVSVSDSLPTHPCSFSPAEPQAARSAQMSSLPPPGC